jgi:hypothetical protein
MICTKHLCGLIEEQPGSSAVYCPLCRAETFNYPLDGMQPISEEEQPKRSKAKRCWICGHKLRSGRNNPRTIDGHKRDLHKFCAKQYEKSEAREDNAFGMEY